MAYMRDNTGRRLDSFRVLDAAPFRVRDLPGVSDLSVMASPPTYTAGVSGAASAISSGVQYHPVNRGAFTYMGGNPTLDVENNMRINASAQIVGTAPPWACEFFLDDDRFEVCYKGASGSGNYRVLVDGQLTSASFIPFKADGGNYKDLFVFGSRARRRIRLEFEATFRFSGVIVSPTGWIVATPEEAISLVIGDSFTEPTIRGTGSFQHDGWVSVFGRGLGLRNMAPRGSGGTGYLNPGTGGRVKFRDRFLSDVVAFDPARVFFAGGINDANREGSSPSYTAAMTYAEALLLFDLAKSELPNAEIGVFSPWCATGVTGSLLAHSLAIKQAAEESGLPFYDLLGMTPDRLRVKTTLTAGISSGSSISVAHFIPQGAMVRVPTTTLSGGIAYRRVTGVSGTGPYTLTLDSAPGTLASGTAVETSGRPWSWGSGRVGATNGSGPNDLYISDDSTHPSPDGHAAAGRAAFQAYVSTLDL